MPPTGSAPPPRDDCPRCGEALRFEDEDGIRECICGWSERFPDTLFDGEADGQDPMRALSG